MNGQNESPPPIGIQLKEAILHIRELQKEISSLKSSAIEEKERYKKIISSVMIDYSTEPDWDDYDLAWNNALETVLRAIDEEN